MLKIILYDIHTAILVVGLVVCIKSMFVFLHFNPHVLGIFQWDIFNQSLMVLGIWFIYLCIYLSVRLSILVDIVGLGSIYFLCFSLRPVYYFFLGLSCVRFKKIILHFICYLECSVLSVSWFELKISMLKN